MSFFCMDFRAFKSLWDVLLTICLISVFYLFKFIIFISGCSRGRDPVSPSGGGGSSCQRRCSTTRSTKRKRKKQTNEKLKEKQMKKTNKWYLKKPTNKQTNRKSENLFLNVFLIFFFDFLLNHFYHSLHLTFSYLLQNLILLTSF